MKPFHTRPSKRRNGVLSIRALAGIAAIVLLPVLLYAGAPAWWTSRHVIGGTASDYATANAGQLKNMATAAFDELSANLPGGVGDMTAPSGTFPGGTGYQLTALINSWSTLSGSTRIAITGSNTSDYAEINLGQLKNVSRLFYKRLIEAGFASYYPWEGSGNPPSDYAKANLGQLKNLFSFDLTTGTATDGGVPDMWEMNWFGTTGLSGTSLAPSGNGLTLLQCYEDGVSPLDYYEGVPPTLTIISGSGQTGPPGEFLPDPLVVQVTGTSGSPLVNAPVEFAVTQGSGILAPDNSGTSQTSSSLMVLTGTNGYAQVYFQQPPDAAFTSNVAAFAEGNEVDFSATTSADTGSPAAAGNVTADIWSDGSVVVEWADNSDNESDFAVKYSADGGATWVSTGTVAADVTNYVVPPSAGIAPGDLICVAAETASGTTNSGSVPAILPVPKINYGTIDISGLNAANASVQADVLSMALSDSGSAAYCFASGSFSGTTSDEGVSYSGTNQVTVNTWNSGTTSSGTINCDSIGQAITTDGTFDFPGLRDESLNSGTSLYSLAANSSDYNWIELPYILGNPPPSVLLDPHGNAYGTVSETCYFPWDGGDPRDWPPIVVDNAFYHLQSGTQTKQIMEFGDPFFTTGTTSLIVNNEYADYSLEEENGGPLGTMVLGCSSAGYCGAGVFGLPNPGLSGSYAAYESDDFFTASYICLTGTTPMGAALSGTTIFYDSTQNLNGFLGGWLPSGTTGFNLVATSFTPAAMNDYGNAIGGTKFWNGTGLVSLGTNAVGTALNNQNMIVGSIPVSGTTTGMLWLTNSGTVSGSATMQSLVALTPYGKEIQNVIPVAVSGTDTNNMVSILCSGSVMESSGTVAAFKSETLRVQVNATTPSGTATPPLVTILDFPATNAVVPLQKMTANGDTWGVGTIFPAPHTTLQKALVSTEAQFMLRSGTNVFQGWDSTDKEFKESWTREPWTCVGLSGTNSLVKLVLSNMGPAMNLELVVAPGSESNISLTNNIISGTETDFNINGIAATGTNSDGSAKDAEIVVREKATTGVAPYTLARLHVYVLPPQTMHFALFYCSDKTHVNTKLPATLSGTQQIADELNATFSPQTNVKFICDGTFTMDNLTVFTPSTGALPYVTGTQEPPAWATIENLSKAAAPNEPSTIWRIFVVNKIQDSYTVAFTPAPPNTNFTFIEANSILRVYSHEAGRALQVSWLGGDTHVFDGVSYGPFDLGPWPLEFGLDGLNIEGQKGLMSDDGNETQTRWIRHEYWRTSNENANQKPFK